ncbi:MAG TPA: PLP-dependent aminotransferase family protein [Gammaproteobacteria bacterium]|nr:PLP-dependent aminotransferase family protein [Gammaproteobacteria bacterium]
MRELTLSVPEDGRPGYLRIAEALRNAVQAGMAKPGEKLPSSRALAALLGVHRHTVIAAMDELVAEGWLEAGERRAHRVASVLPSQFFKPQSGKSTGLARVIKWNFARLGGSCICTPEDGADYKHLFQSGLPDLRLFPYDEFRACLAATMRDVPAVLGGYGDPAGHPGFIERFGDYLRRVRALTGREIIVTHGTQEAVFLVAQLLLAPGRRVAVECPGYKSAWDAFTAAGAELVPVKVDEQGMDPEALEAAIAKGAIHLIYLTPHHQYPTTVTLPAARRLRIYELASRHQIPIFEDDYDHEFHYRCQPIAPMASNDPSGLVIYSSTLSKIMFPSIRIGFLAVPPVLREPLSSLLTITSRQNSVFMQDAVARWMDSGGFERHLRRMRRVYEERRDAVVQSLEASKARGLRLAWNAPDGGMALWMDCGADAEEVTRRAAEAGVFVNSESNYHPGTVRRRSHLRLGYANQNPDELRAGLSLLMETIASVQGAEARTPRRATA